LAYPERAGQSVCALLLFLLLSYGPQIYVVHAIRPEALYTCLSSLVLVLLVVSLNASFGRRIVLAACFAGIFVSAVKYYVKPHWESLWFSLICAPGLRSGHFCWAVLPFGSACRSFHARQLLFSLD
jgi:hypothetical protein